MAWEGGTGGANGQLTGLETHKGLQVHRVWGSLKGWSHAKDWSPGLCRELVRLSMVPGSS